MEEKSGIWGKIQVITSFCKKHAVLLTLLLVLVLQFVPSPQGSYPWGGVWIRMQSKDLPVADSAAASSVDNYLRQQASIVVSKQYPNLPDSNKQKVLNDVMKKIRDEHKDEIDAQQDRIAQEVRNHYSYEVDGRKFGYMPDIDTYYYLRYARNIEEKGHSYDILNDGVPWDNHMVAPIGTVSDPSWHPHVAVLIHRIASIFDSKITLMESSNYFPVIFVFLSLIFTFFIARKVSGNIGGFFAATMLALLPAIMNRTPWGHFDTDAYNVFFPVVAVWLLFLALSAESWKKQVLYAALTGLSIAVYSNLWTGWWYLFDFVMGAFAVSIVVEIITHFKNLKEGLGSLWAHSRIKKFLIIAVVVFVSTAFFCVLTPTGLVKFMDDAFRGAFRFTLIKEASLPSLWPNVFTTVAELNPASFSQVISSIGGTLIFAIAILGILLLLLKRDEHGKFDVTYSALLTLWFIGTIYAALKGSRFTLLLGPAFAVAFGAAGGLLTQRLSSFGERHLHLNKIITNILVIVIFGLVIINPVTAGANMVRNSWGSVVNDVPIMNDAWWNSLTRIKDNSQSNAIINSWWDFGHHFKFVADRAVTSDGATQNSPQAHWVGRVLQTNNEDEAVAILRMLDCGANSAFDFALNTTKDPVVSIKLVKEMIMQDKETAGKLAQEAGVSEEILRYTHCEPPEDFFIASSDMVGKAGVWAHFGLWGFERAEVWQKWRLMDEAESVPEMVKRFNWTEDTAKQTYRDANALTSEEAANAWISPWPGYLAGDASSCTTSGDKAVCGNIAINLSSKRAEVRMNQGIAIAGKVVLYDRAGGKKEYTIDGGNAGLVVVFWPTGSGMNTLAASEPLADSMFTRMYYMKGLGLKHFKPFAEERQLIGGMIYVYKVDWEGKDAFIPNELTPKEKIESGAQVSLSYIGWTDDNKVFDSSIPNWKSLNITPDSRFDDFETKPLSFVAGAEKVVPGFEKRIQGMKKGETKTITVPPEEAYGTDPSKHQLGNKTLHFKIRIDALQ